MRTVFALGAALSLGACASIAGLEEPRDVAPEASVAVVEAGTAETGVAGEPDATTDADAAIETCDEPGLLARWKMDEGAGAIAHDCTSGAHDGTIAGAQWIAGKVGPGALAFLDDAVDVGNPPALQLTGAFSVSAWVKANRVDVSGRIISKSSQVDRGWELNVENNATIEFKVATDTASYLQVTSAIAAGEWHHVAGVYAPGDSLRVYLDGVEKGSLTAGVPAAQRNAPFDVYLGAMPNETCCRLDGALDDVRVYGRALAAAEVQALAQ